MSEVHEVRTVMRDGLHFEGYTDDPDNETFSIQLDADQDAGGQGRGLRPVKLLLVGLAGCMSMDVASILRKKRQELTGLEVRVRAERAPDHPKVYTHIWVNVVVTGHAVDPSAVERAIELSITRYCPVANLLKPVVPIETAYEIHDA